MKHTPTPWKLDKEGGFTITDSSDRTSDASDIAYVNPEKENWGDKYDGDPEANGEFIVRAVNSHDALLEALRNCVKNFTWPEFGDEGYGRAVEVFQQAEAAISQAETI
jgi:hypothetical protein